MSVSTRLCILLTYLLWSLPASANDWTFEQPIEVTEVYGKGIFHHLESAGRRNIAVAGKTVAISWEDNRDGNPAIYFSHKSRTASNFSPAMRISGKDDAYEPSLVALDAKRFAIAWEETGQILLRLTDGEQLGPVHVLEDQNAGQASLGVLDNRLWLVYAAADQSTRHRRIYLRQLAANGLSLAVGQPCAVVTPPLKLALLVPTGVPLPTGTVVSWEDRRLGHTIIMAAENPQPGQCNFTPPQRISEPTPGPRPPYGKGHGVTRVAMSAYGRQHILAAWADKRDFREGYDIYASHYPVVGQSLFGPNQKVQDPFGGVAQQWHPTVAGHSNGTLAVAWDDDRDGQASILLSVYREEEWSDDISVPGASGEAVQNHPTLTLDSDGNLHLAWVERGTVDGPTRLRYLFATAGSSSP